MEKHPFQNIWGNPVIGKGTKIAAFVEIGSTKDNPTIIGEDCKIEAFAFIPPGIMISSGVFIGPHVCFTNDKHPKSKGDWNCLGTFVLEGASIGAGAVILPGIVIGKRAVIGAGATVTKDIPNGQTVKGNSAK